MRLFLYKYNHIVLPRLFNSVALAAHAHHVAT